jgi:hypothetical protein
MDQSQPNSDTIVGSAEPLSPEETEERLRQLAEWGVDLSLVQASLERTPTERIERLEAALDLAEELRKGYGARATSVAQAQDRKP